MAVQTGRFVSVAVESAAAMTAAGFTAAVEPSVDPDAHVRVARTAVIVTCAVGTIAVGWFSRGSTE